MVEIALAAFGFAALSGQLWAGYYFHGQRLDRHEQKLNQINGTQGKHGNRLTALETTCRERGTRWPDGECKPHDGK